MNACVVTTIHKPTAAIEKLHEIFGSNLIVVGDKKTPEDWNYKDVTYIPFVDPGKQWFEGVDPVNHYARKNLGYLEAIRRGATYIFSTDDDNTPVETWNVRTNGVRATISTHTGWFNVYKSLAPHTREIWPRGFALNHLHRESNTTLEPYPKTSSIQQGMADGDPDVDAIWRLLYNRKHHFFNQKSVFLAEDTWCPFNSQSTHFFPKAFALMYLPVTVSFRMTDIFGSFVAQRCLWEIGEGVTFHSPSEVYQNRNEHDLLKDFEDEIPGYLNSDKIATILQALTLQPGEENICANMVACYEALANADIIPQLEVRCVKSWIKQYEQIITTNMG